MEIIQLTEENIDKYHLVTRLEKSREELINIIESNFRTDHITYIYLDKVNIPWPSAILGSSQKCPRLNG